ncbi:hypothetical protein FLP41_14455 [Paracoccus marcusii]|nr:hypothetical protein FLP41_14455 [Paracoccus marcusii]
MTRGEPIPDIVTLRVPFRVVKRGGRKEMHLPEGTTQPRRTDNTLVRRWRAPSDGRGCSNPGVRHHRRVGRARGIAPSYMTRVLRLTLLAPEIVEAIMDGRQKPKVTLAQVLEPFPLAWQHQASSFSL